MAMDALTLAGKQYSELLQEYDKVHNELQQAGAMLQQIATGELDPKRLKSVPGGVQVMPKQPTAPEKPSKNGKNSEVSGVPEVAL